jgi:predicted PurR-regulated permease PerM
MRWLVLGLVGLLVYILWPAITAILLGGFAAVLIWRPVEASVRHFAGHRGLLAVAATLLLVIAVLIPVAAIVYVIVHEIVALLAWWSKGGLTAFVAHLPAYAQKLAARYDRSAASLVATVGAFLPKLLGDVGSYVVEAILAIITLFYSLWRGAEMVDFVRRASPLASVHTEALIDECEAVAKGLFWGNVVIAGLHGVFGAIGYFIAGVPEVFFLGAVTMFASFIPGIGTAVVWVPMAIVLWLFGHAWQSIFIVCWGVVVIGGIDQLLRPILARRGTRMPTPLMFLTIYGGLVIFGLKGLILGPLFGALATAALRIVTRGRAQIVIVTATGARSSDEKRPRQRWPARMFARARAALASAAHFVRARVFRRQALH